ncbi:MAG: MFS transporter [Legionellaceae bacterium]|nr:MFS transporter [Legionellaceae bacterium]
MNHQIKSISKILYPWVIWILAASFFYYKYLIQVSPGVMSKELMGAYSLSGAGLGNLAACFFYGYLLMQIPVGILLDKWSPGKITAVAAFFCALGIFLFANTHSFLTAGVSRFIIGVSASFAAVSCFKLTSIWFAPKRFALLAGLSMTAAMFGAVGGQRPLSILIHHFGWRGSLELIALAGFVLSILIWIVIKDKKSPIPNPVEDAVNNNTKLLDKIKTIIKDKQTWLLSLYSGLAFAPISVFGGLWGVSFIETAYKLDVSEAASSISLIFIGFAVGCPITGWLSDYIGRRKPIMMLGTILSLISLSSILYLPLTNLYLSVFLFLFGIGASCFFLCFSMIREMHSLIITGTVLGFMNTFDSICEAITEPFIGKLLDLQWDGTFSNEAREFTISNYHKSLLALCVYLVASIILLMFIKETFCSPISKTDHDIN